MSLEVVGFNLISLNCVESALVYSKVLNLPIIKKNEFHAELKLDKFILYFNKPSLECKVSSGSLTLKGRLELSHEPFFQLEQEIPQKYKSFLDKYGNRIWILN